MKNLKTLSVGLGDLVMVRSGLETVPWTNRARERGDSGEAMGETEEGTRNRNCFSQC